MGTATATPTETFTEKFRQIGNVPTLPTAATRALAIVNDPNCSIRDFSKIIETDPALGTSLLKLVNSSFYSGGTKISDIHNAIVRLGLRETQNLILAVSVRSVFRWMPKGQEAERDRLWRHSSLTGVLSRQINEKLGFGFKGEEFSAGLSHDLGRIMLAVGYPDVFCKLANQKTTDENHLLRLEMEMLGFTHPELGAWLTTMWNLPDELTEAILYHHDPAKAPRHAVLAATVSLAEELANFMEMTKQVEGADISHNPGWSFMCSQWESVDNLDAELFANAIMSDAVTEAETLSLLSA
jgi:HD-like signal output (HDOD) protein